MISQAERDMIDRYLTACSQRLYGHTPDRSTLNITRRSAMPCDLSIEYQEAGRCCSHSVWLPLGCIAELVNWTSPEVAYLTNHPTMALMGDWSGVRDSNYTNLWAIFERFVLKK